MKLAYTQGGRTVHSTLTVFHTAAFVGGMIKQEVGREGAAWTDGPGSFRMVVGSTWLGIRPSLPPVAMWLEEEALCFWLITVGEPSFPTAGLRIADCASCGAGLMTAPEGSLCVLVGVLQASECGPLRSCSLQGLVEIT